MTKTTVEQKPVLGFLGGTFDPVHNGHLRLAVQALENLGLSQVGFIPSASPPHKIDGVTKAEHRLAMLKQTLENHPRFFIDHREYQRQTPSWTIDSVKELRQQYGPTASLVWLLGADSLQQISSWKCWEQILEYVHIAVFPRQEQSWLKIEKIGKIASWVEEHKGIKEDVKRLPCGKIVYLDTPLLDVSSTEIRHMLSNGEDVSCWLDSATIDYIKKYQLYN